MPAIDRRAFLGTAMIGGALPLTSPRGAAPSSVAQDTKP